LFFFEKKNQKTFANLMRALRQATVQIEKSLLLLFFRKEDSFFFPKHAEGPGLHRGLHIAPSLAAGCQNAEASPAGIIQVAAASIQ
jgi:hypothetical protein